LRLGGVVDGEAERGGQEMQEKYSDGSVGDITPLSEVGQLAKSLRKEDVVKIDLFEASRPDRWQPIGEVKPTPKKRDKKKRKRKRAKAARRRNRRG